MVLCSLLTIGVAMSLVKLDLLYVLYLAGGSMVIVLVFRCLLLYLSRSIINRLRLVDSHSAHGVFSKEPGGILVHTDSKFMLALDGQASRRCLHLFGFACVIGEVLKCWLHYLNSGLLVRRCHTFFKG